MKVDLFLDGEMGEWTVRNCPHEARVISRSSQILKVAEKRGFETTSGAAGRPWWDDAIEFALAPPGWGGRFLHQIVTADAVTFQETVVIESDLREQSALPVVCAARRYDDRFTIEVAIPLGAAGIPVPQAGATWRGQFMRTRVMPDGQREHAAWTLTDSFHDAAKFGTIAFR